MITRIGILVLETTTITTKLIEGITVEIYNNSSRNNNYNDQINRGDYGRNSNNNSSRNNGFNPNSRTNIRFFEERI
jgi:hypothetical protein